MDKLSFLIRREADISTRYGQLERLYDIADRVEALEAIAKRYEDAPVSIIEGYRLDWDETLQFSAWTKQVRALNGQRVRIVLDKEG